MVQAGIWVNKLNTVNHLEHSLSWYHWWGDEKSRFFWTLFWTLGIHSSDVQSMICNCTHFYCITLGVLAKKSHDLVYLTSMLACYHALFERPPWSSIYSKRYIFNSYRWFTYWYMYIMVIEVVLHFPVKRQLLK